jgi:hypothetical protein
MRDLAPLPRPGQRRIPVDARNFPRILLVIASWLGSNAIVLWSPALVAQAANDVVCRRCVGPTDLATGAVDSRSIRDNSITGTDLKNGSVGSDDIRDESITGADIADGSITPADLATSNALVRTIVVSPVGSDTDNCGVLYATHDGITDAEQRNRYRIYIEPGIYDCRGRGALAMKQYVDITGAGRDSTLVVGDAQTTESGAVIAADHTTLSNLEVLNQPEAATAVASQALLLNSTTDFTVSNARLRAIFAGTCRPVAALGAV